MPHRGPSLCIASRLVAADRRNTLRSRASGISGSGRGNSCRKSQSFVHAPCSLRRRQTWSLSNDQDPRGERQTRESLLLASRVSRNPKRGETSLQSGGASRLCQRARSRDASRSCRNRSWFESITTSTLNSSLLHLRQDVRGRGQRLWRLEAGHPRTGNALRASSEGRPETERRITPPPPRRRRNAAINRQRLGAWRLPLGIGKTAASWLFHPHTLTPSPHCLQPGMPKTTITHFIGSCPASKSARSAASPSGRP